MRTVTEKDTRELRRVFEVTQQELSEITGIPLATIKNWDSRKCMPSYMFYLIWCTLEKNVNDEE